MSAGQEYFDAIYTELFGPNPSEEPMKKTPPPPKNWIDIDPDHKVIVIGHLWELVDLYHKMRMDARSFRHPQPELAELYHLMGYAIRDGIRVLNDRIYWKEWTNQELFRREVIYHFLMSKSDGYLRENPYLRQQGLLSLATRTSDSAEAHLAAARFLGWADPKEAPVEKSWGVVNLLVEYMNHIEWLHYK